MEIYINCSSADINKFVHQHNRVKDAKENGNICDISFSYIFLYILSSAMFWKILRSPYLTVVDIQWMNMIFENKFLRKNKCLGLHKTLITKTRKMTWVLFLSVTFITCVFLSGQCLLSIFLSRRSWRWSYRRHLHHNNLQFKIPQPFQ